MSSWHYCVELVKMPIIAILTSSVRSVNIADLRNRLTHYLREVRAGEEIVVRDGQRPIAKIVPFTVDDEAADDVALVASGLMAQGHRRSSAVVLEGTSPSHLARDRCRSGEC